MAVCPPGFWFVTICAGLFAFGETTKGFKSYFRSKYDLPYYCFAVLAQKEGAGHGWKNMNADEKEFVAWFDKYLDNRKTAKK